MLIQQELPQDERRLNEDRRTGIDRRQIRAGMIDNYVNYSGPERRKSDNRRQNTDRRL